MKQTSGRFCSTHLNSLYLKSQPPCVNTNNSLVVAYLYTDSPLLPPQQPGFLHGMWLPDRKSTFPFSWLWLCN